MLVCMLKANQDKLTLNHHNAGPRSRVPLLGVGMYGTLIGSLSVLCTCTWYMCCETTLFLYMQVQY